ncbi:hypothetical protein [Sporolactobacillus shoreae]|uniref:hypothetical protein n=1 Tax=Sporolactobacillus shoreae TaxID=1465501 RepID=UPI001432FC38|nr:hypothetical protein [Sporolactobacillus shoreae]
MNIFRLNLIRRKKYPLLIVKDGQDNIPFERLTSKVSGNIPRSVYHQSRAK